MEKKIIVIHDLTYPMKFVKNEDQNIDPGEDGSG